ncbi:hypothetical protein THAOC_29611, partial [Thalassiosira oceanica]
LLSEFNAFRCEQVRSNEDQKIALEQQKTALEQQQRSNEDQKIALEQQQKSNADLKIALEEQQSHHKIALGDQKIALDQQQSQINALMETIGKLSQNTLFDKICTVLTGRRVYDSIEGVTTEVELA